MCQDPPQLDRSAQQQLDLSSANVNWRQKYAADPAWFHFGFAPYSPAENVGYFLDVDGTVIAMRKGGNRIGDWGSFKDFLSAELPRVESQYEWFETRISAISKAGPR